MKRWETAGLIGSSVLQVVMVLLFVIICCMDVVGVDGATHVADKETKAKNNVLTSAEVSKSSLNKIADDFSPKNDISKCERFFMIVSTIDGKVSALNLHKKGSLVWSVQADDRPLYSSSLTSMEINHDGKKMRLIPSLNGALYQFDGDKVEAVPLSAESLLSSTYKLSDDYMIVGSKDTRSFGVNINTGDIQFTCGSEGCSNSQGNSKNKSLDENTFLILTRSTQVVRSVDIKNGNEKWNFSIGQHQITLPSTENPSNLNNKDSAEYDVPYVKTDSDDCSNKDTKRRCNGASNNDNRFQLLMSDGLIKAFNKRNLNEVSWEYKFDCPIVNAWLLHHNKVEEMKLFDDDDIPSLNVYTPEVSEKENVPRPLLYIGSHQKLPYIQASPRFESVLKSFTNNRIGNFIDINLKVSWRPYLNTASVRTPIFGGNRQQIVRHRRLLSQQNKKESTSLSVWHEQYPFDTGYFLYPEFCDAKSMQRRKVMLIEDLSALTNQSWLKRFTSLYWKELVMIIAGISLLVYIYRRQIFNDDLLLYWKSYFSAFLRHQDSNNIDKMTLDNTSLLAGDYVSKLEQYVSRFDTDFNCLHGIGKGGFGVVFEAVNRVDDQHYAIKRILLPKNVEAREKVLREVKALAKLEHVGIVRYFNAWVESPPNGWQEERDKLLYLSDATGSASYSNTSSQIQAKHFLQSEPEHNKIRGTRKKSDNLFNNNVCPFNPVSDMEKQEISSSQISHEGHYLKHTCSEEFSVHSSFDEIFDEKSENGLINSEENVFLSDTYVEDSISYNNTNDTSSILFSSYSSGLLQLQSQIPYNSVQEMSGDSIVFEYTSNKSKPVNQSLVCDKERSSFDSNAFKNNLEKCETDSSNKSCSQQSYSEKLSFPSLMNNKKESKDENSNQEPSLLTGTKIFLYIQMQLCRKETLKEWLTTNTINRDRFTLLHFFDQITSAVDYVHRQGLMHRDLKPSNIFFTADETVKVGDFGLVTDLCAQCDQECETDVKSSKKHTADVGTTLYMSPEQVSRKTYNHKVDIFSLGLILLELLIPFNTQMERTRTLQDAKKHNFPSEFCRDLPLESELVHKMTDTDSALRPNTEEILNHPLLFEFRPTRTDSRLRKRTISSNSIN